MRINTIALFKKQFRSGVVVSRNITKEITSDKDSINYCANIVRQHDYENFLATLLMTKAIRSPALVVRAFNVEVARIQDQTSDIQTAAFRLQFWQDALKDIYTNDQTLQNIPANPIVQELFKICCCYSLPRRYFEKLVTSRSNLLKTKYFNTIEDIEKYAEESVSSIYYLLLAVAGVKNVNADHAASHLGKAQGITNILRSLHVSNQQKMVMLPMDVLMKYEVSQESVLRGLDSESMRTVAFEVASRANLHLEKARKIVVPKVTHQIFLPAIAVNSYLKSLQKHHFNLFDKSLHRGNATLPLSLYFNRIMNSF